MRWWKSHRPRRKWFLKADRQASVLRVQSTHLEAGAPAGTRGELAQELTEMARWLGLEAVE